MSNNQPKVSYMGQKVEFEDLPEAEAASIEDYFAPVILSGKAIDLASQIIPEEYWKPVGIHTWLQGRADLAFRKILNVKDKEITMGGLRYVFEYTAQGPQLKTVTRI